MEESVGLITDSPAWSAYTNNLGVGLSDYYIHTGELSSLQEAIGIHQRLPRTNGVNSIDRATHSTNLGSTLRARYLRSGDFTDLDNAIVVYQGG